MGTIAGVRKERVEGLLQKACNYYGVSLDELVSTRKGRDGKCSVWKWKRYFILMLYDNTDLDLAEIQTALGYKSQSAVNHHFSTLRDELSDSIYGTQKTKTNYKELINYMGL